MNGTGPNGSSVANTYPKSLRLFGAEPFPNYREVPLYARCYAAPTCQGTNEKLASFRRSIMLLQVTARM